MVATAAAGDVCVSNCLRGSSWNRLSPGAQDALSWEPEVGTRGRTHLEEFGEGARGLPKVGIHLHQPPQPAGQLPPCSLWPEALVAQDDGPIVTTVADDSPHCLIDRSASQAGR